MTTELDYLRNKPFLQYEELTIVHAPRSFVVSNPCFRATHFRGEVVPGGAVQLYTGRDFTIDPKYHRAPPDPGKFFEARTAMRAVPPALLAQLDADTKAWHAARGAYAKKNTLAEATRLARDYATAKAVFEAAVSAIESRGAQLQADEYHEDSEYRVICVKCPVTGLYASHKLEQLV